jgi:hypothetical protein
VLGASLVASAAFAAEGPADQKKPNATAPVDYKAVGVTDKVIAMIDLDKEPANIKDRKFRMRKLTIEPGGIAPCHSHGDRPAIIYIIRGEINEYASNCAVLHKSSSSARTRLTKHAEAKNSPLPYTAIAWCLLKVWAMPFELRLLKRLEQIFTHRSEFGNAQQLQEASILPKIMLPLKFWPPTHGS